MERKKEPQKCIRVIPKGLCPRRYQSRGCLAQGIKFSNMGDGCVCNTVILLSLVWSAASTSGKLPQVILMSPKVAKLGPKPSIV